MTVKQWLSHAIFCDREIKVLAETKARELARYASVTGGTDGPVVSGGRDPHRLDNYIAMLDSLDEQIDELAAFKRLVCDTIAQVEDANSRNVLMLRYVNCLTWAQVADRLHYDVRHVTRIHGYALQAVAAYVPEEALRE